jgi:probable rRNA maturation factor
MDITLEIDQAFQQNVDPDLIERAVRSTLHYFLNQASPSAAPPARAVTIVITDNETIQQLNHQYRGIAAPTDVLSFENVLDADFPELDPTLAGHLGDIIIAYPVAQAQALAGGHTPQDEVILLTVHGLLHLLGFDHDTPESQEKMWTVQNQIMTQLGLAHIQPTEN